eukprot:GHVL01027455.1.p1 GENE.GHVL01027455.1~~GHVL01027455.1.p1  ORF type:complete len:531 (+),score=63.30 GHVL01027455.1:33-1625(+)
MFLPLFTVVSAVSFSRSFLQMSKRTDDLEYIDNYMKTDQKSLWPIVPQAMGGFVTQHNDYCHSSTNFWIMHDSPWLPLIWDPSPTSEKNEEEAGEEEETDTGTEEEEGEEEERRRKTGRSMMSECYKVQNETGFPSSFILTVDEAFNCFTRVSYFEIIFFNGDKFDLEKLHFIIQALDVNGDNVIEATEFQPIDMFDKHDLGVLSTIVYDDNKKTIQTKKINKIDWNTSRDGLLSFNEFCHFMYEEYFSRLFEFKTKTYEFWRLASWDMHKNLSFLEFLPLFYFLERNPEFTSYYYLSTGNPISPFLETAMKYYCERVYTELDEDNHLTYHEFVAMFFYQAHSAATTPMAYTHILDNPTPLLSRDLSKYPRCTPQHEAYKSCLELGEQMKRGEFLQNVYKSPADQSIYSNLGLPIYNYILHLNQKELYIEDFEMGLRHNHEVLLNSSKRYNPRIFPGRRGKTNGGHALLYIEAIMKLHVTHNLNSREEEESADDHDDDHDGEESAGEESAETSFEIYSRIVKNDPDNDCP